MQYIIEFNISTRFILYHLGNVKVGRERFVKYCISVAHKIKAYINNFSTTQTPEVYNSTNKGKTVGWA